MEHKKIQLYGKIAKFPKNAKAGKAYSFLESIKMPKNKLWYFIIEKELVVKDGTKEELQLIKYNNKNGINCTLFIEKLKEYYEKDEIMSGYIKNMEITGNDKFSVIKNIPKVEVGGRKLISILTEDLIKLLYK